MVSTHGSALTSKTGTRPSLGWQIARIALAGSRRQAFLDHRWIEHMLRLAPASRRRALALRILSLSPHYFIYQWERYPAEWDRRHILAAEDDRNRRSRQQIAEQILRPAIAQSDMVLDFGCGPGYLAAEIRALTGAEVIAVDVSAGTLACARVLNPGPSYRLNRQGRLPIRDGSIDVVYSIAVFQHLDSGDWPRCFAEFSRVLRAGGRGICHVALADHVPVTYREPAGIRARYSLRFEEHSRDAVRSAISAAGFADVRVEPAGGVMSIEDDVGRQHIARFRKPV